MVIAWNDPYFLFLLWLDCLISGAPVYFVTCE
jgi:hypothetical protein